MPVNDPPLTVALFQDRRTESAALYVSSLAVVRHVSNNRVFQCGPGRVARQMNLDVAEFVLGVLHLSHLGNQMVIAVIGPAVISMAALKDRQRFVVSPNSCRFGDIVLGEA